MKAIMRPYRISSGYWVKGVGFTAVFDTFKEAHEFVEEASFDIRPVIIGPFEQALEERGE